MMMFAVMMLISVSAAFAGNSDALKAILKSEDYVEANKLVQSTLDQLADNAEKASAYNKVVDLALAAFNDQAKLAAANKADEAKMYDALETAFTAADECYKYDQLPNAKGKGQGTLRKGQRSASLTAPPLPNQCRWLLSGQGLSACFQASEFLHKHQRQSNVR